MKSACKLEVLVSSVKSGTWDKIFELLFKFCVEVWSNVKYAKHFLRPVSALRLLLAYNIYFICSTYVVGSKSFRPDIQKPRQMENAVRDI